MGRLSGRTLIHFGDGRTLTDLDVDVHGIDVDQVTSIERVVQGIHLTILKSNVIQSFFITTNANQRLPVSAGGGKAPPAGPTIIQMRTLGCYLKESDPPVRCLLSMDPRTKNVYFEASWVKKMRLDGFAARLMPRKKGTLVKEVYKSVDDCRWTMTNEPPVRRVFGTPEGLGCLISINANRRAVAEIRSRGKASRNVHLLIQYE